SFNSAPEGIVSEEPPPPRPGRYFATIASPSGLSPPRDIDLKPPLSSRPMPTWPPSLGEPTPWPCGSQCSSPALDLPGERGSILFIILSLVYGTVTALLLVMTLPFPLVAVTSHST